MTTLSSRVPAVLDALTALFTAAVPGAVVVDGPQVTASPAPDVVHVGWDGDDDGDGQAVEFEQAWTGIGAGHKDETIQVTCAVVCEDGGDDLRAVRLRAYGLFASLEAALRADPGQGLAPPTVVAIIGGALRQEQNENGVLVRLPFVVAVKTRI